MERCAKARVERRHAFILVLATFVLVSIAVLGTAQQAFAEVIPPDYTDESFKFSLQSKGSTAGTEWRSKGSSSSIYVNIQSKTGSTCRGYVDGARSSTGSGKIDCTLKTVYYSKTGKYKIQNHVYESGRAWTRLTAWANAGSGTVKGLWSPDCAGSYPVLNQ